MCHCRVNECAGMAAEERSHWPMAFGVALSRATCRSASGVALQLGHNRDPCPVNRGESSRVAPADGDPRLGIRDSAVNRKVTA
jgi:hypothetical protein